jgi:tRNA-dihydrouridine synthase B
MSTSIGSISLDGRVMLAPMAGITDSAWRRIARRYGASMVFTEMISAEGICRDDRKTIELSSFLECERPVAIQLFGSDPDRMGLAASKLSARAPDALDINMGCPARKVIKGGSGSALLKDLSRVSHMAQAVVESVVVPVFAKIRSGWDEDNVVAVGAAEALEDAGIAAVTIHPRTCRQGFKGKADWDIIGRVKKSVGIPVIGCGDIERPTDVLSMMDETGCDFVMIGRAATGNPWIFSSANTLLEHGWEPASETDPAKLTLAMRHLRYMVELKGEGRGVREMRKHVAAYTKGMPRSASFRAEYFGMDKFLEAFRSLKRYKESLEVQQANGREDSRASQGV